MKGLLLHFIAFMSMLYASTARPWLPQRVCLAFHQRAPIVRARRWTALTTLRYPYRRNALITYSCAGEKQSLATRLYSASSTQNADDEKPSAGRRPADDDEEPSSEESSSSTVKISPSHNHDEPPSKKKAAQHELDHRIRHKGMVEASQLLAEKFVEAVERPVGKKLAEHTGERLVERSAERAAERVGEYAVGQRILKEGLSRAAGERVGENVAGRIGERGIIERLGERTVERVGERAAERAGERVGERVFERGGERLIREAGEVAVKGTEKLVEGAGEKLSERLAERTAERLSEQAGERFAEQTAERASKHLTGQISTKVSGKRISEHLAARNAGRLTEETGERLAERIGSKAMKPAAERIVERAEQSILSREINSLSRWMKQSWNYIFARKSAPHAVERSVESTVERIGERSMGQTGHITGAGSGLIVARRLGRGTLIAIPALGGLFVLHILRQDLARCRLEWQVGKGLVGRYCWAGAVLADGMDVFAHGMIVYSLLVLQTHHIPLAFEQLSLGCAIISTVCAVVGELFSKTKHGDNTLKGKDTGQQN